MREHHKFFMLSIGALVALLLDNTIASVLNPVLASIKLNYQ
jgi:hypothetical protein